MIRIHTETFVPKYETGVWHWNEAKNGLEFEERHGASYINEEFVITNDLKFQRKLNPLQEVVYRQEFQRKYNTHDADVILLSDVRNLVLFLAPLHILRRDFVEFVHLRVVMDFFKALVIYFEHFLKVSEFVVIRHDEMHEGMKKMQSQDSIKLRRIFASHLTQYRLLLAREYSQILLCLEETKPYYHTNPQVRITRTRWDRNFFEALMAFSTQLVWICMHRRSYDVIDMEMGRLFRSEHFMLRRFETIVYNRAEQTTLYGKNYRRVNYRAQTSPLVQELASVARMNAPVLWFGRRKYRGTDLRMHQMELECIVPESQLSMIDCAHGILGHPKKLYNTLLQIDWEAVRFQNYSKTYDPFRLVNQPYLEMPKLNEDELRKHAETYNSLFVLKYHAEKVDPEMYVKWTKRDEIIEYFATGGVIISVMSRAEQEMARTSYGPSVQDIITRFKRDKEKLRKK